MATENLDQEYVWPVELRPNSITERTDDYTAAVKTFNRTKSVTDIAKALTKSRTEYREDTIVGIIGMAEDIIRDYVYNGYSVQLENVRFAPTVTGSFDSHGDLLEGSQMRCSVNVIPTNLFNNGFQNVKLYFDTVQELGGAKIDRVKDLTTGKTDGTVTPGGMVEITGNKIKCVNEDGSGIGHFRLYNESESPEEVTVLGVNDPSKIIFIFPTGLLAGNYRLEIETYFSASSAPLLKNPRTLVCSIPLKIS